MDSVSERSSAERSSAEGARGGVGRLRRAESSATAATDLSDHTTTKDIVDWHDDARFVDDTLENHLEREPFSQWSANLLPVWLQKSDCLAKVAASHPFATAWTLSMALHLAVGLVLGLVVGPLVDAALRPGAPPISLELWLTGLGCALPLLGLSEVFKRWRGARKTLRSLRVPSSISCEVVYHFLFLVSIGLATQFSFSAQNRFVFSTRAANMVNDDFLLDGLYPGALEKIDSISNVYEWLRGPMLENFVCEVPPEPWNGTGPRDLCTLPSGVFLSDGRLEVRTLRVKAEEGDRLSYFTDRDQRVTVNGNAVRWGGKYSRGCDGDTDCEDWPFPRLGAGTLLRYQPSVFRNTDGVNVTTGLRYGWYDTYSFGGQALVLDPSPKRARAQIDALEAGGFMDFRTRVVRVATVVANPALGLWALVDVLVETPEEGAIHVDTEVYVLRKFDSVSSGVLSAHVSILMLLLATFMIYMLLHEVRRCLVKGLRHYASKPGNWLQCTLIGCAADGIYLLLRAQYSFPDLTQDDAGEQILAAGYQLNRMMQECSNILGLTLFILTMRTLKFIPKLSRRFSLISETMSRAMTDVLVFLAMALFIVAAFTIFFSFTLGAYFVEFSSLANSLYTVLLGISALWDPAKWYYVEPVYASLQLFLFTCICTWLLTTMIIAIVTEAFTAAKEQVMQRIELGTLQKSREQERLLDWCEDPYSDRPGSEGKVREQQQQQSSSSPLGEPTGGEDVGAGGRASGVRVSGAYGSQPDRSVSPPGRLLHKSTMQNLLESITKSGLVNLLANPSRLGFERGVCYKVKLVVWSATGVCDSGAVADPYVKVRLLGEAAALDARDVSPENNKLTRTIRNERNPVWNEPFVFYLSDLERQRIALAVYDSDRFTADDLLAYILVPVSILSGGGGEPGIVCTKTFVLRPSTVQVARTKLMRALSSTYDDGDRELKPVTLKVSFCVHKLEPQLPPSPAPRLPRATKRSSLLFDAGRKMSSFWNTPRDELLHQPKGTSVKFASEAL